MSKRDYYEVLGITKSATADEIKRAFRKLAHQYHPDKTGGDEAKFKEINAAYQVLSDDTKRKQYDQFGHGFEQAGAGFGGGGYDPFGGGFQNGGFKVDFEDLGDVFGDFFGGGRGAQRASASSGRGSDVEMRMDIDFMDAVFGAERDIEFRTRVACGTCTGSGLAAGAKMISCTTCGGSGNVKATVNTFFGQMQTAKACASCQGQGSSPEKTCPTCKGDGRAPGTKKLTVNIPAGINEGEMLKLRGQGEAGWRGQTAGDLYLHMHVTPHPTFVRDGYTIRTLVEIPYTTAVLGGHIDVETVDGTHKLKIPAGTKPMTVLTITGKGVPQPHRGSKRGDHEVTVTIHVPKKVSGEERRILEKLIN